MVGRGTTHHPKRSHFPVIWMLIGYGFFFFLNGTGLAQQCSPGDFTCLAKSQIDSHFVQQKTSTQFIAPSLKGLDQNAINQAAGIPTNIDAKSLADLPVKCRDSGKPLLGDLPCQDQGKNPGYFTFVEKMTRAALASESLNYYQGLSTNFVTGVSLLSAVPVCNLTQNEVDKNFLASNNKCGDFCNMEIKTDILTASAKLVVDDQLTHCDREYGWYRGAYVQVLNFYKEKVFSEFRAKDLQLVDIDGARPCAEAAADVLRIETAAENALNEIIAMHGLEKLQSLSDSSDCALLADPGVAPKPTRSVASEFQHDATSHGVCRMNMANRRLMVMWSNVLGCEIRWRAAKEFDAQFSNPDKWVSDAQNAIEPKCSEAGQCKKNGQSVLSFGEVCTDKKRTELFNSCYQQALPAFLKQSLEKYKTREPIELPKNTSASTANGMAGLAFARLTKLRSWAKRKKKRRVSGFPIIILLFTLSFSVNGCFSCGDETNITCLPCQPLTAQDQKACLYRTCINTVYFCAGLNSSKPASTSSVSGSSQDGQISFSNLDNLEATGATVVCMRNTNSSDTLAAKRFENPDFLAKFSEAYEKAARGDQSALPQFAQNNGLKIDTLSDARAVCRKVAKRLGSGEDDPNLSSAELAAIQSAIDSPQASSQQTGVDQSCPSIPSGNGPELNNASVALEAAQDIAETKALFGTNNLDVPDGANLAQEKTKTLGGGSATEAQRLGAGLGVPSAGGKKGAGGAALPKFSLPNEIPDGSVGATTKASNRSIGAFDSDGSAQGENNTASGEYGGTGTATDDIKFGLAKSGDTAKRKKTNPFGNDSIDPAGGGAATANFGNRGLASSNELDLDSYLNRVGKSSLFEIINRRMERWGHQLEVEQAQTEFKRTSN